MGITAEFLVYLESYYVFSYFHDFFKLKFVSNFDELCFQIQDKC